MKTKCPRVDNLEFWMKKAN